MAQGYYQRWRTDGFVERPDKVYDWRCELVGSSVERGPRYTYDYRRLYINCTPYIDVRQYFCGQAINS